MSGLKINYQKSSMIPINCEDDWVDRACRSLKCGVTKLPFTYLGIPLGACPRKIQTWKPIIEKVEKRLALWKVKSLSKAGRLTLIKAVLQNLPMYYLSLFRMPKSVAHRLVQLQRRFFWGNEGKKNGGNLIAWDIIQKPLSQGGLGIGDILTRNASLLVKWWRRFEDDNRALWKDIVESNHGISYFRGNQNMSGSSRSSVWGQIVDINNFTKEIQEVTRRSLRIKIGNGARTSFWFDAWTGNDSLNILFPRLFHLSTQKNSHVDEMGRWENGEWRWITQWRRNLFAWEEESFKELLNVVNRQSLRENKSDMRCWPCDASGSFSVSNFVMQVTDLMGNENLNGECGRLAWSKAAPPRAQLLVWFLLHGRLNTKERLFRLGVGRIEDDRCVFCKEYSESIEHLFFACKPSSSLWYFCCNKWNISVCLPFHPKECLLSWMGAPFKKFDRTLWAAMFYIITLSIWDIRNKVAFQNVKPNWEFEKKRLLWRLGTWAKGWYPDFPFSPELCAENLNRIREWKAPRKTRRGTH